jgi:hypothetical protein
MRLFGNQQPSNAGLKGTLPMSHTIGIVCGHGETIAPDNPKYSSFFAMLRDHRFQVEPLPDKLTTGALADYPDVLIGGSVRLASVESGRTARSG